MNSEQMHELAAALAKAQGEMRAATFNKVNPHFKSKYADLAAVWEAIRVPLSSNGLSITQAEEPANSNGQNVIGWILRTTLWHTSGQWVSSVHPLPYDVTPQQFGSALTYARRYALSALVGIAADEDDDANEAQKVPITKTIIAPMADAGDPREIPLGTSPDWAWFSRQMVEVSTSDKWPAWRAANMVNMNRMQTESPKVYAIMISQLRGTRG